MINLSKDILAQIVEDYTPDSIYIVGSAIQKITNYNDIDILVLYKNDADYLKNKQRRQYSDIDGRRIEVFVNSYEQEIASTINVFYAWTSLKLAICIYGDNLLDLYNFDDYDLIKSKDYRRKVCGCILNELKYVTKRAKKMPDTENPRYWTNYLYKCYRMLLVCYIINNKSYNLTNEQIIMLNKVHDEKDMSEDLWIWCKNILESEAHQQQWTY